MRRRSTAHGVSYGLPVLTPTLAVLLLLAPDEIAITWDAPPSCPDVGSVRERIAEQLRGARTEPTAVRARVSAPDAQGAPWRLWIAIGDEGQRHIEGHSCTALVDAAAVMVAISLETADEPVPLDVPEPPPEPAPGDPLTIEATPTPQTEQATRGATSRPAALPPGVAGADDATVPAPDARPSSRSSRPRRGRARAVLGVTTGLHGVGLPAPGAGLGGRLGVRWGPLSAAITGTHWFQRQRPVTGEVAASYRLGTAGLDLCGALPLGRVPAAFELLGCGRGEAGVLRAEGLGATPSRTRHHPWVALGGAATAMWLPRPWVGLGLRAEVVAPLLGRRFVIGDASAGAVGPVDARGTLELEFRLPPS